MPSAVPHPLPYQGSKRALAGRILARLPGRVATLHEPFAGSAAVSLAALYAGRAGAVVLNDANQPLMALWSAVLDDPHHLADGYARLWQEQLADPAAYFTRVRAEFNADPAPHRLLYLLARCVKAAVRYNARGEFNQAADRRRLGARPEAMRARLVGAHRLLAGRARLTAGDYRDALAAVGPGDVVYLDPPYQGVSTGRDGRYVGGVAVAEIADVLAELVERDVAFCLSYDGRCGATAYGELLPDTLGLARIELDAGRSASATLHGRSDRTVESLYLSPALLRRTRRGAA